MEPIKLIESYLDNSLDKEEIEAFEQRMKDDPSFAEEVKLHAEVNQSIVEDDIEDYRTLISPMIRKSSKTKLRLYRVISGIAATLIIAFGLFHFNRKPQDYIINKFYSPYQTDLSSRSSVTKSSNIDFAYKLYQQEEYEAAYELLKNYNTEVFDNTTAQFYLGLSALEIEKLDVAQEYLEQVTQNPSSPYSIHAKWYLSQVYLKTGEKVKFNEVLSDLAQTNNYYTKKAKKLQRTRRKN